MPEQSRQLAAIMFSDIVGYTDLMGKDQQRALEVVGKNRELHKPLIEQFGGRLIKEMGDGLMASFSTASEAIQCAHEVQKKAWSDEDLTLRIGIHLGEVVVEGHDVFGDGVNIASRLQTIADPGGIYISESVHKSIRGMDITSKYLGELRLKNVDYPVKTYAIQGEGLPIPEAREEKQLSGTFWAELQRRGVIRAAISYLVVALLLFLLWNQAHSWDITLPQWSATLFITGLIVGFPVAMYLAWNYERSPEGMVRTISEQSWQNPYKASQKKPFTSSLIIAVLVGIIILMYFFPQFRQKQISTSDDQNVKSIAIPPFRNLSEDPKQQYFAEGIAEMIRSNLSRVGDLRVTSMRSVMQYRDGEKTVPQIASELDVATVLEGSVLKDEDNVRVIVQLIDAPVDEHLWSETYDRKLTHIFEIQAEIAEKVVSELQAQLTKEENFLIANVTEVNLEAYQYFLSGQNSYNGYLRTEDSDLNDMAISQFQKALQIEPGYAPAWSGLSSAFLVRTSYGYGDAWLDSSAQAAQKAIELDPKLGDPYLILGRIELAHDDSEKALAHLNQVTSLDPNNSAALYQVGWINIRKKNFKEGILQLIESFRLNPTSDTPEHQNFYGNLAFLYYAAGMFEMAEELIRKQISLYPRAEHYELLDFTLWRQGKWDESKQAIKNIRRDIESNPNPNLYHFCFLGLHYWLLGHIEEAEMFYTKILQMLREDYEESYVFDRVFRFRLADIWLKHGKEEQAIELLKENLRILEQKLKAGFPYAEWDIAHVHLLLGDKEECYRWIDKIPYDGIISQGLRVDPSFDEIRGEPRFQAKLAEFAKEDEKIRNTLQEIEIEEQLRWVLER